jgi:serine protease
VVDAAGHGMQLGTDHYRRQPTVGRGIARGVTMTDEHNCRRRSFLKRIGAASVLAGVAGEGSAAATGHEVVVGVEDDSTIEEVEEQIAADPDIPGRAKVVHHNEVIDYAVVEIPGPSTQAAEQAHEAVGKHDGVKYAERDYEITLEVEEIQAVTPNDPRWSEEWAEEAINVPTAWETTLGSMDTTLAILDTGLDVTHPDLEPRTTDEVGGSDPVPSGSDDHGTHCGGCAAATTGNGIGVAGPTNARLLGYNIFDNIRGEDAIIEAADLGADVISLSWSVGYSTQQSLADAIQYATDQGTVVVAASANDGRTDAVTYPAMDPNVIAVGATDESGSVAGFSNSGPNLDVVAPGVSILSTLPQESYGRASGTSMACPVTAGVVALAKELDPSLTTSEVRDLLTSTATTLSGVPAGRQAAGQIDAAAVVDELSGGGGGAISAGNYRIINENSGKALEIEGGSTANGANAQQWTPANVAHHRWSVQPNGDGTYQILAAHSGKALDVSGISTDSGANVHQWDYVGGSNQHWRIESNGDGTYTVIADHSGLALDVSGSGTSNGTNVQQWTPNGSGAQRWRFEPV